MSLRSRHPCVISAPYEDEKHVTNGLLLLAWVHILDEDDEDYAPKNSLPRPDNARIAQHNTSPSTKHHHQQPIAEDLDNDAYVQGSNRQSASRWKPFVSASEYPRLAAERGEVVSEEWLLEHGADYSRPWLADTDDGDMEQGLAKRAMFKARRRAWYERAQRTILRSPIIPMVIRMIVFGFSIIALSLASSIHHITDNTDGLNQTPSTNMAIIVDAIALVYLLFITYDEYHGPPLGIRATHAKIRLIFLDLFFIVFDSANLSLAFEALQNKDPCQVNSPACSNGASVVRMQQRTLASMLLIALIAWLLTFSISVLRSVFASVQALRFHLLMLRPDSSKRYPPNERLLNAHYFQSQGRVLNWPSGLSIDPAARCETVGLSAIEDMMTSYLGNKY